MTKGPGLLLAQEHGISPGDIPKKTRPLQALYKTSSGSRENMKIDYSRSIIDIILGHEKTVPDRAALILDQGDGPQSSLTYAELAAQIRRMAGALAAQGLAGRRIA